MRGDEVGAAATTSQGRAWDLHSKRAVTAGLTEVLALTGAPPRDGWAQQTVDLPAGAHRADLVFLSDDGVVVHVEIQQAPDPDMAGRMAEYAVRVVRTEPYRTRATDLVQIVVQVTGLPMAVDLHLGGLRNDVRLLHVPTIAWDDIPRDSPLTPFALVSGGVERVPAVVEAIAAAPPGDLRASMAMLALYASPALTDTLIEAIRRIGMVDVIEVVRQTDFGRSLAEEGRQEGRQEGRHEGEWETLVRVLSARFPGADRARVERTATRLQEQLGHESAGAVLAVEELDSTA